MLVTPQISLRLVDKVDITKNQDDSHPPVQAMGDLNAHSRITNFLLLDVRGTNGREKTNGKIKRKEGEFEALGTLEHG